MDNNGVMNWDDVLDTDGEVSYIELEEGDYTFTVTNVEKKQFPGGQKIPPCPKAEVQLEVDCDRGKAFAKVDLILYSSLKWKLSAFFRCVGMKRHGEDLRMRWDEVPGKRGRAHFVPRAYTARDGSIRHANEVESFYDYDETLMTTVPVAGASWENMEV